MSNRAEEEEEADDEQREMLDNLANTQFKSKWAVWSLCHSSEKHGPGTEVARVGWMIQGPIANPNQCIAWLTGLELDLVDSAFRQTLGCAVFLGLGGALWAHGPA